MNVVMRHNIMTGNDHLVIEDNRHDFHQEIARYFKLFLILYSLFNIFIVHIHSVLIY